jgi:hypothetical protein
VTLPTIVNELNRPTLTETNGIRRFDDANIQRAVERALALIPPEQHVAVVAHADGDFTLGGASLTAVARMGDAWTVMVAAYKPYKGGLKNLTLGAEVVWTPKLFS